MVISSRPFQNIIVLLAHAVKRKLVIVQLLLDNFNGPLQLAAFGILLLDHTV